MKLKSIAYLLGILSTCAHVGQSRAAVDGEGLLSAAPYAVSNGFTTTRHPEGSHLHSSNLAILPPENPPVPNLHVAEVGGFFGEEEVRGLSEFDLTNQSLGTTATLLFDVFDVTAVAGQTVGGLFGQDPFDGTIDVFGYRGNNVEEVSDYEVSPVVSLGNFNATGLNAGDTIEIDITDFYGELVSDVLANPATAAKALGIRLQVAPPADTNDPDTGAIAFDNFRIQVIPEPHAIVLLMMAVAGWMLARSRRG